MKLPPLVFQDTKMMKLFTVLAVVTTLVGLALAQDYNEKKDDNYSQSYRRPSRYGSSYRRYGSSYSHSGYGYGYKKCPKLADPENGDVRITGIRPGSKALHKCDEGFNLVGKKVRVCQRDGTWSDQAPTCAPVDCGDPDDPDPNGSVEVDQTIFRSIATYSCNVGYLFDITQGGSEVVTCQANGEWSDTAPACMPVDCQRPPLEDVNGDVQFDETTLGNEATYTCDAGFELESGEATFVIQCLASGQWSDAAPTCNPVNCGNPPDADSNGSVRFGSTTFRSTALYECNDGFILDTSNGGSQVIYCQADELWSGSSPACARINCGYLDTPTNGKVVFDTDTKLGSSATFSCRRGFKLVGDQVRVCQASGDWSLSQPSCERIQCPKLAAPAYGKILVSGYYVDDYAVYRCAYGFALSGDNRRVCQEDGTWSGSEPKCDAVKKYYGHNDNYGYGDNYGYDDDKYGYGHGKDHESSDY